MKIEDLAFVNRQLAAMLKSGIPLEGSLRQLCGDMRRGRLRDELQLLERDLSQGMPLEKALGARHLPEIYTRMLRVGARSEDLPRTLTLLADYYDQQHGLWARLKGLMVYPAFVMGGALALSGLCGSVFSRLVHQEVEGMAQSYADILGGAALPSLTQMVLNHRGVLSLAIWMPAWVLGLLFLAILAVLVLAPLRRRLRFRLPVVRETAIAQFAASMGLMLQGGCTLAEAVGFLGQVEAGNPLGEELLGWSARLHAGATKFLEVVGERSLFPPFFRWLVASAGEDLPDGFRQAAELYQLRALRGREFLLYAALPAATLGLGVMIAIQVYCMFVALLGLFLPVIGVLP